MSEPRKLALVTGSHARIGAAIAGTLAEAGFDLILHGREDHAVDSVMGDVIRNEYGAEFSFLSADFCDASAADTLWEESCSIGGRAPSLVVNNASLFEDSDIHTLEPEDFLRTLQVNLVAPVRLAQRLYHATPIDEQNTVINILDQRVLNPVPDQLGYTVSKQALWQATRTLAKAMAPRVRVNAIAPGPTLPLQSYDPAKWEDVTSDLPLGESPSHWNVAKAAVFAATTLSMTGQTIFIDGGAHLESYARDFPYLESPNNVSGKPFKL